MPKSRAPYPSEYRAEMVRLVRMNRTGFIGPKRGCSQDPTGAVYHRCDMNIPVGVHPTVYIYLTF